MTSPTPNASRTGSEPRRRPPRPRPAAALTFLFALACAPPTAAGNALPRPERSALDSLRASIDSMVAAPQFANAFWGILIVDPATGDTLYARNAGKLFLPASNMKIVTGSVALAQLGPDYRYRTTVAARGPMRGDTLAGDLVVYGRGDPSLSDHMRTDALVPFREMADSLSARGIGRIAGRLLPGDSVFPTPGYGAGWSWDDFGYAYSAPVAALYVNEGFDTVVVRAGARAGDRATLVGARRFGGYPPVVVEVVTGDSTTDTDIEPARPGVGDTIRLTGVIAPHDSATVEIVFPSQRAAYFAALRQALSERGITVGGEWLPATGGTVDTLFTYRSPPLREILPALLKPSQNQIAEILLRTVGLERTGTGTPDSGLAVVRAQLGAWGVDSTGAIVVDGSGLSRFDYLTPQTIVRTLAAIRADTAFAAFYDALPIAGVDGTIERRMRGTPAQGVLRAKTGYIANARSLSGYVTTRDGRMLIFSALCNNWTAPRREVDLVQDRIGAGLAGLDLGRARAAERSEARRGLAPGA